MYDRLRTLIAVMAQAALLSMTIAQGSSSNIEEPRQIVARTAAEWQSLWKEHDPQSPAPAVEFADSMVVGVFLGSRPTAGFSVDITAAKVEAGGLVVEYVEKRPSVDTVVAQVLTSPYHLVRVTRTGGPVEFRRVNG